MPEPHDRGLRVTSSEADRLEYEETARQVAGQLLIDQKADVSSMDSVHVREAFANRDLDGNDETMDDYVVNVDDPVWETEYEDGDAEEWQGWYALDDGGEMDDKAAIIYGFQNVGEDPLNSVSIRVRNRTGGLIEKYDLTSIDLDDDKTALIENPLRHGTRSFFFEIYSPEDEEIDNIKPLMAVAEEEGDTLEDSTRRFITHSV